MFRHGLIANSQQYQRCAFYGSADVQARGYMALKKLTQEEMYIPPYLPVHTCI